MLLSIGYSTTWNKDTHTNTNEQVVSSTYVRVKKKSLDIMQCSKMMQEEEEEGGGGEGRLVQP